MLHLVVLAMITASDLNSSAASAPAAKLEQQLSGSAFGTGLALDTNGGFEQTLVKICTYGTPPLGSNLFGDAPGLMRAMTTPACADGTDFQSAFANQPYPAFFLAGSKSPALTNSSPGDPVQLIGTTAGVPTRHATTALTSFSGPGTLTFHVPKREMGTPVENSRGRVSQHQRRQ